MRDTLTTGLELAGFAATAVGLIVGLGFLAGALIAGGLASVAAGWILGGDK